MKPTEKLELVVKGIVELRSAVLTEYRGHVGTNHISFVSFTGTGTSAIRE